MKKINNVLRTLFFILVLSAVFCIGRIYQELSENKFILLKTNNVNKASIINDFLENENISIKKIKGKYIVLLETKNESEYFETLVKLAENGFIDDDFIKYSDSDFLKIRPKQLKKHIKDYTFKEIKHIDGVYNAKVKFIPPENNQPSEFLIKVSIFDDFNQEKINKTITILLSLYPDSKKTISFSKSGLVVSDEWKSIKHNQILAFYKNKQYEKALALVKQVNEKRPETFKTYCYENIARINREIEKNPNDYKLYLDRGKLQISARTSYLKSEYDKELSGCQAEFGDIDNMDSAISDFEKVLELNPNFNEVYKYLYIAYMYPNIYSNKPSYSDKALYYMLKSEEYNPDYKLYEDLADFYYHKNDYYKAEEYFLKSKNEKTKIKYNVPDLPIAEKPFYSKMLDYIPQSCNSERNEIKKYDKALKTAEENILKYPNEEKYVLIKNELENKLEDFKSNMPYFCKFNN